MACLTEACKNVVTLTTKINKAFADAASVVFNKHRFGIKDCRIEHDPYRLLELKEIYLRSVELESCDSQLDSCLGCDLETIQETLKTL